MKAGDVVVEFMAPGDPIPQGSMVAVPSATTGRTFLKASNEAKLRKYRDGLAVAAGIAFRAPMLDRPHAFEVRVLFTFRRPGNHYGTGRNADVLKATAPPRPIAESAGRNATTGDVDKCARALLDSLTGVIYRDDSQVVRLIAEKAYAAPGTGPRTSVSVRCLEGVEE